jgi:choline dehydrogenase-like flavoprotein
MLVYDMVLIRVHLDNFFAGWNSIGVRTQPQPNAGDANGAFYSPISLKARNQSRSTAADAYYRPIAGKRKNFHLLTGQVVTKVKFGGKKRATSVDVSGIMGDYSCRLSSDFRRRLVRVAQHEQQQRSDQR